MDKAHYIIFHPEKSRQKIKVLAKSLINNQLIENWTGNIFVDCIGVGNEDPFIFNNPWIYSFCHASQLKRNFNRNNNYLQKGSILLFANCQQAEKGILEFDTVFIVDECQKWKNNPLDLPNKYKAILNNRNSELWNRHFKFPFDGVHKTVSFTYEAALWSNENNLFSFLPLDKNGNRVNFPIDKLSLDISCEINRKIKGKYPVLLDDKQMEIVFNCVKELSTTFVIKDIKPIEDISKQGSKCKC